MMTMNVDVFPAAGISIVIFTIGLILLLCDHQLLLLWLADRVLHSTLCLQIVLYNEAQQDAKVAQTTLTYILTVHRNEKKIKIK